MPSPNYSADPTSWKFFEQLAELYLAAGDVPPCKSVVGLHEIADEDAAVALLSAVKAMAPTPSDALAGAKAVLSALDSYRNHRDFQARPAVEPLGKLIRTRRRDRVRVLQALLSDPDTARVLSTWLLQGARAAGIDPLAVDRPLAGTPRLPDRFDGNWALTLAARSDFDRILHSALAQKPKITLTLDLVSRFRHLAKFPTRRRLCNLLIDARSGGWETFQTVADVLRHGARCSVYARRTATGRWLFAAANNPDDLRRIAKAAHGLALKSVHGPGRANNRDLDRYSDRIAEIYRGLTGKSITYAKATATSSARVYGRGLRFMIWALRLVDASADAAQAQHQIDRLRWVRAGRRHAQ